MCWRSLHQICDGDLLREDRSGGTHPIMLSLAHTQHAAELPGAAASLIDQRPLIGWLSEM